MNFKQLTIKDLDEWEVWLNYLNQDCIVPKSVLCNTLLQEDMIKILQKQVKSHQNIPYIVSGAHLSKRYINEAWIWAQVLQTCLPVQQITELCSGASILIDLTLSYLNFDKSFEKIDYQVWDKVDRHEIKKKYRPTFKNLNVITHTSSIPLTDIVILNHSIDDLYMGLWNEDHNEGYWEEFCDWEKVDALWDRAIPDLDTYFPVLKSFFKNLIMRLHPGGWLIIRDYPSAYETHRRHLARINFTKKLTQSLIQDILDTDMISHHPRLNDSYHPFVQDSFFCLSKRRHQQAIRLIVK